jgi:methyl-accepting chemotaxis protein
MPDIWKSVNYLVRCDEGALRMAGQLRDWIEQTNHVFLGIANGLPHLEREMDDGRRALNEMHAKIADESAYSGESSPRHQIVRTFLQLIGVHQQDQIDLAAFTSLFQVVHEVRTALGSLADLMEDVECFSVNAIVQAHNAGDRGRGFSQVSREVVSLTKRAALEFERVRAQAREIEENLEQLNQDVVKAQERFEQSPIRVQSDIDSLFTDLDEARARVLRQVETLTAGVADSASRINQMLVGLQFDDRCSQVSTHLAQALRRLHDRIGRLTDREREPDWTGTDLDDLVGTVCYGLGVFELAGSLVGGMEDELAQARVEMSAFLEAMAADMQQKADTTVSVDELMDVIRKTRDGLEAFVRYMRELVSGKAEIVTRAEALAGQIFDLRDDLEGVRRTAKRFGVMASIIKVELASAGLSEEFGDALSADRVENLYRDMASAVGSVLISLDTTVKQVQRRCGEFRRGLVAQEDTLRQAEGYTSRLVHELDGTLVGYLTRGGSSFKNTLAKLHRESTALRLEVGNIMSLSRQSGRIKSEAQSRGFRLREIEAELVEWAGVEAWAQHEEQVRQALADCTLKAPRAMTPADPGEEAPEATEAEDAPQASQASQAAEDVPEDAAPDAEEPVAA